MKKNLLSILFVTGFLLVSNAASSAGIPIFYSNGTQFAELCDLPEEAIDAYGEKLSFGVAFEQFSLMWVPMWNYGETQYVLIAENGNDAYTLDEEDLQYLKEECGIDTDKSPASQIPFWHKIGGKLIWGALLAFLIWGSIGKKKEENEELALDEEDLSSDNETVADEAEEEEEEEELADDETAADDKKEA